MCTVVVSTSRWLNIIILCLNSLLKLLFILTTRLSSPICYVSKSVLFFISSFFLSFFFTSLILSTLSLSLSPLIRSPIRSFPFFLGTSIKLLLSFVYSLSQSLSLSTSHFLKIPLHSFSLLDNLIKRNPLSLSLSFSHFFS